VYFYVAALKDRLDKLEADMKKELTKVFLLYRIILLSLTGFFFILPRIFIFFLVQDLMLCC